MHDSTSHSPFLPLGKHLRYLREQIDESVAEVSGAVEIDIDKLERIEQGKERPSEDILMLLINHFNIQDNDAVRLWEMAGYESKNDFPPIADILNKPTMVILAMDMRTQYTDGVSAQGDKRGVTLTFTQGKSMPVARVGMSREQATIVLKALETALLQAEYLDGPKQLPPSAGDTPQA